MFPACGGAGRNRSEAGSGGMELRKKARPVTSRRVNVPAEGISILKIARAAENRFAKLPGCVP